MSQAGSYGSGGGGGSGITIIQGNTGSITGSTVTIQGTGPLSTAGALTTMTITTTAANVINATSGTATASSNAFTVVGAGTVSTSATGSTLTITGAGGGMTWNNVTSGTQTFANNNGYICNNGASLITFTLPATAAIGNIYSVQGYSSGGWTIAQNAGQTIHTNAGSSTTGVTGTLSSTLQYDTVTLLCTVTDTDFVVHDSMGNPNLI